VSRGNIEPVDSWDEEIAGAWARDCWTPQNPVES